MVNKTRFILEKAALIGFVWATAHVVHNGGGVAGLVVEFGIQFFIICVVLYLALAGCDVVKKPEAAKPLAVSGSALDAQGGGKP